MEKRHARRYRGVKPPAENSFDCSRAYVETASRLNANTQRSLEKSLRKQYLNDIGYRFGPGGTNLRSSYRELRSREFQDTAKPFGAKSQVFRLRDLVPAALLLACGLIALSVASLWSEANEDKFVVVAPPGWSLGRTIALVRSGDGRLVRTGNFANVVFASSSDPHFAAHLRAAGAWLVESVPLAPGCSASKDSEQ